METLAPLPPDITITREDVHALPRGPYDVDISPAAGQPWTLARRENGRICWVDDMGRALTPNEYGVAERAFLWRTALASDAALCDIAEDIAEEHVPMVDVARRIAALRAELDAYEGRAGQA